MGRGRGKRREEGEALRVVRDREIVIVEMEGLF